LPPFAIDDQIKFCRLLHRQISGLGLIAGAAFTPFAIAGSTTFLLVSGIYRTWSETLVLIASPNKS
jgi:hypothetical protein